MSMLSVTWQPKLYKDPHLLMQETNMVVRYLYRVGRPATDYMYNQTEVSNVNFVIFEQYHASTHWSDM